MFKLAISIVLLGFARSQSQTNPFAGSRCKADTFCNYECAIKPYPVQAVNQTFYRMTMLGVYDLENKNTGDVLGDAGFVVYQRDQAYKCTQDPDSILCKGKAIFDGTSANNTDLILEMQVEFDQQYGPYLQCNPDNNTDVFGSWNCTNTQP